MTRFRAPQHSVPLDMERLGDYLSAHGMTLERRSPPRQFAGGLANLNYLVVVNGEPTVLRRPPEGSLPPGAHDMAREHRVLSRLWQALPLAPRGIHLCEDRTIIGVPFQLVEYREGIVISGDDRSRFEGRPDIAAALATTMLETLVRIHAVDVRAVGLDDLGRPEGFVQRAIAGWRRRAARLECDAAARARAGAIAEWLERQPVRHRAPVLLHCDFKLDNLILAPETLTPVAIVDWDMSTRGDPLFDLATWLSYWTEPGDPPCMHRLAQMPTAAAGFPTRRQMVDAYASATGRDVEDFHVLRVLATFKLAVVFLQLHALHASGARSAPQSAHFDRLGADLLQFAHDIARAGAV